MGFEDKGVFKVFRFSGDGGGGAKIAVGKSKRL